MKKLYLLIILISGGMYAQLGNFCNDPIVVATLPYTTSDNTANYGDNYDPPTSASVACGAGTSGNFYLSGNDVIYSITPTVSGTINIQLPSSVAWVGLFVFTNCSDIGGAPYACNCSSSAGDRVINNMIVTAGQTYYIVISSWAAPQTIAYTMNITGTAFLGVQDNVVNNTIDIYPNPVKNELIINSSLTIQEVVLFNLNGQQVLRKSVDFNKVSLSELPTGFYMIEMKDTNGAVYTKKVLKTN